MHETLFVAKELSVKARTFLYACAFWTVAADEHLKSGEQQWLIEQFGEDGATQSLDEFVTLESDAFFDAFDGAVMAMSDEEKRIIYPQLGMWLLSCALSDGDEAAEEKKIIDNIKERVSLDSEIQRLTGTELAGKEVSVDTVPAAEVELSVDDKPRILTGHDGEVTSVCVSPDGRTIVSASEDMTVKLWDLEKGAERRTFQGHEMGVSDVCFCSGRVVSSDRMGKLNLWDVESGKCVWTHQTKRQGGVTSIDVSSDEKHLIVASDVGIITLRDIEQGKEVLHFGEKRRGSVHSVRFSPDGKFVLTGGDDKTVRLWDISTGSEVKAFEGHEDGVMSVNFSPDAKVAISGSRDNTLKMWDIDMGKEMLTFEGHSFSVMSVCFSPQGQTVLSASWDHTMKLWDAQSARQIFNFESVNDRFSSAVFHPDGSCIVMGDSNKAIHIVRLREGSAQK